MKLETGKLNVLVIGDLHTPFHHQDALPFLQKLQKVYKTSEVVCMGDEVDFHALSQFTHDPDGLSAGDELKAAIAALQTFYDAFPTVKVCQSNHTERYLKRAYGAGIPRAMMKEYREVLQAPAGWTWAPNWEVDGVLYEHGEGVNGQNAAIKAALANRQSTVIGHVHSYAGISYNTNRKNSLFGFNVGCLVDDAAYAFRYAITNRVKPSLGAGVVIKGVPEFIPLLLDKNNRWTGKL